MRWKKIWYEFKRDQLKYLYKRDKGKCQECNKLIPIRDATRGHIIPQSHHGKDTLDNLQLECRDCNSNKADSCPGCTHCLVDQD